MAQLTGLLGRLSGPSHLCLCLNSPQLQPFFVGDFLVPTAAGHARWCWVVVVYASMVRKRVRWPLGQPCFMVWVRASSIPYLCAGALRILRPCSRILRPCDGASRILRPCDSASRNPQPCDACARGWWQWVPALQEGGCSPVQGPVSDTPTGSGGATGGHDTQGGRPHARQLTTRHTCMPVRTPGGSPPDLLTHLCAGRCA